MIEVVEIVVARAVMGQIPFKPPVARLPTVGYANDPCGIAIFKRLL
jgi:hypothetical protein